MATLRETLYNEGEAIDYTDFNEMQRFMRAALNDGVLAPLCRQSDVDYGLGPVLIGPQSMRILGNAAPPSITGSSLAVTVGPGWVGQFYSSAASFGTDPNMIWHYVGGSEDTLVYTSGAAHATLPRWDILQAKIDMVEDGPETRDFMHPTTGVLSSQTFNKMRRTRFNAGIVPGTAAASPVEPDPAAGYVKLFAWRIEAAATAITTANFRDYRMPMGFSVVDVLGIDMARVSTFSTNGDGAIIANGSTTNTAYADPQRGGAPWRTGRLLAVGLVSDVVAGSTATALLQQADYADITIGTFSTRLDVTAQLINPSDGAKFRGRLLYDQAIWMDGTHAPTVAGTYDFEVFGIPTAKTTLNKLRLSLSSGPTHADRFQLARFYVAGM